MITTWAERLREIHDACERAATLLAGLGNPRLAAEAKTLREQLRAATEDHPPVIAFVGQYDAGKSSLIKALTGADVAISADIETSKATAFPWRGLVLVDTPGVQAGRPAHDAETERWLARADLILFVITTELFDDVGGAYFRRLAHEGARADLMMLVVNKLGRERSGPEALEHMRPSLARVLAPRTLEDLRWVAIDAKSALDAEHEAPGSSDARELRARSRLDLLEATLGAFARDKGMLGRALAPLHAAIGLLEQARDEAAAGDDHDRKDYLELARRRGDHLRDARTRIELGAGTAIATRAATVRQSSRELLRLLTPEDITAPPDQAAIDGALEKARQALTAAADLLTRDLEALVATQLTRLNADVAALGDSPLARSLSARVIKLDAPEVETELDPPAGMGKSDPALRAKLTAGLKGLGKTLVAAEKGEVVKVARFFGAKFRPWGAGKALARVNVLGKALGALGPVLDLVFHVLDERRREAAERELGTSRLAIRTDFNDAADELQQSSKAALDAMLEEVFGPATVAVDAERARWRDEASRRNAAVASAAAELDSARGVLKRAVGVG